MHPDLRFLLLAGAATLLGTAATHADTLSWGSLNPTYAPTSAQTVQRTNLATVNGNTVSIQFGNNTFFSTASSASPAVGTNGTNTTAYTNGGFTGKAALQIIADFDNSAGNLIANSAIPVTVFFSQPVSGLMFSFYDLDSGTTNSGGYTDQVNNIFGLGTGGAAVVPVSLAPGAVNKPTTQGVTTSLTATGNSAQTSGDGNAGVTFGNTPITQFSFTYTDAASGTGGTAHSTIQVLGLSDLTFTTVPEPSALALLGLGGVAGLWFLRTLRLARPQLGAVGAPPSEMANPPEFPVAYVKVPVLQRP